MPIVYENQLYDNCKLAVWQITESVDELEQLLWICEKQELDSINVAEKKLQWLAARVLLQQLLPATNNTYLLSKDKYGKPLLDNSLGYCSLSHSGSYVAAALHAKNPVGIDIQLMNSKILNIAQKFVNETEQTAISLADALLQTHVIWGAKESLFKLYGKGNVDFKKHLTVMPFEMTSQGHTTAFIDMEDYQGLCSIHFSHTDEYVLVTGVLQ